MQALFKSSTLIHPSPSKNLIKKKSLKVQFKKKSIFKQFYLDQTNQTLLEVLRTDP